MHPEPCAEHAQYNSRRLKQSRSYNSVDCAPMHTRHALSDAQPFAPMRIRHALSDSQPFDAQSSIYIYCPNILQTV